MVPVTVDVEWTEREASDTGLLPKTHAGHMKRGYWKAVALASVLLLVVAAVSAAALRVPSSKATTQTYRTIVRDEMSPQFVAIEGNTKSDARSQLALDVPSLFASHMVLQQGVVTRLQGTATPGSGPVTCRFRGVEVSSGDVDPQTGGWEVHIPAMNASLEGSIIEISSKDASLILSDVTVGDVYFCAGASQMYFKLNWSADAEAEIAQSSVYSDRLRLMQVLAPEPSQFWTYLPPQENFTARVPWQRVTPDSMQDFSALCYYFGVEQLRNRPDIPVGLIESARGATNAPQWAPSEALQECNITEVSAGIGKYSEPSQTSILWNTMVAPLTVLPIRGIVAEIHGWAESSCIVPAVVNHWRATWRNRTGNATLAGMPPFVAFQYGCNPKGHPGTRYHDDAYLRSPHTGVAVTAGSCDPAREHRHSPLKKGEARQMALVAERVMHGNDSVPASGPRPVAVYVDPLSISEGGDCRDARWGIRVKFDQELAQVLLLNATCDDFHLDLVADGPTCGSRSPREIADMARRGTCDMTYRVGQDDPTMVRIDATIAPGLRLGHLNYATVAFPKMPLANRWGMLAAQFNMSLEEGLLGPAEYRFLPSDDLV